MKEENVILEKSYAFALKIMSSVLQADIVAPLIAEIETIKRILTSIVKSSDN